MIALMLTLGTSLIASLLLNYLQHRSFERMQRQSARENMVLLAKLSEFADRVMHFENRTWTLPPQPSVSPPPEEEIVDPEFVPYS